MYEMRSNEFSSIIRYSKNVNKHTHLYTYISMYLLHNPHYINKMRKNSDIRIALVCLVKFCCIFFCVVGNFIQKMKIITMKSAQKKE